MNLTPSADAALLELLEALARQDYRFVTPTPETHRRVVTRRAEARTLRDIFGWNLPFAPDALAPRLLQLLRDAGALTPEGQGLKSLVRVATLGGKLFLHSAFPTDARDSVFFGPDTYRFADFLRAEIPRGRQPERLVDIGSGSGAGAISAAPLLTQARLTLTDVNPLALRLAAINARHAGLTVEPIECQGLEGVAGPIDLVIANPPYIMDAGARMYRDGGDMHGGRISLDWALEAARRLGPGGRMLLYTGSAIVAGHDGLREALDAQLPALGCTVDYREIDPDVFGEELERPNYADVERIAAVGAVIAKQ